MAYAKEFENAKRYRLPINKVYQVQAVIDQANDNNKAALKLLIRHY